MPKSLSQKEFENMIKDKFNDEYIVLSEYKGRRDDIKLFHTKCMTEFTIKAANLFDKRNKSDYSPCPICSNKSINLTAELYRKKIFMQTNGELIPISDYINDKTEIWYKHIKCGFKFRNRPNNIKEAIRKNIENYKCPNCGKTHSMDSETFRDLFNFKDIANEYKLLTDYVDDYTDIYILHKNCGYKYYIRPSLFTRRGHRCPKCNGGISYNIDTVRNKIDNVRKGRFKLISNDYTNRDTELIIKDSVCNSTFKTTFKEFFPTCRCKKCEDSSSIGENYIKEYLNTHNIKYEREKRFDGLKYKSDLRYDFYIEDFNLLLEFDGIQHFREYDYFSTTLKERHDKDIIKNEFAIKNKINLLRIPYIYINKIDFILDSYFNNKDVKYNIYISSDKIKKGENYYKIK